VTRCTAKHKTLGIRCARRQNHVGNCWSEWQYDRDPGRFRYKWLRHGMKWTF